jgi:transmembrane sensor
MSSKNLEIDDLAAEWATKRDLRELTPEEQAAFDSWLAADIRHFGAYGRAEAVLAQLERTRGARLQPPASPEGLEPPRWSRRRILLTGSTAASLLGVAFAGAALWRASRYEDFSTDVGQTREVVLADGSIVTLNTESHISVRYTPARREIRLLQGEALFDVTKNRKRPFIVVADDAQVKAIGTRFTVSMLPRRPIQVLVKDGVVELKRISSTSTAPVRATANEQILAPRDAPITTTAMPESKLERNLAWQYGRIALDNQTLQDAADEFARYSDVRIVVDPAVATRTVTGLFVSNDPIGFAKAAAAVLKLNVEVKGRMVRLFAWPEKDSIGKS